MYLNISSILWKYTKFLYWYLSHYWFTGNDYKRCRKYRIFHNYVTKYLERCLDEIFIVSAQKTVGENSSDVPNVNIDWRQTSNSVTLFYKDTRNYAGIYYQLQRLSDSKLIFRLAFEKHVVIHEIELNADVEWPPICERNFDTMQVNWIKLRNC